MIADNEAQSGSGGGVLLVVNSIGEILDCDFTGNVAFEFGGGLVAFDESTVSLRRSSFIGNAAQMGGAFIGFGDASINLNDPDDNTYSDNIPEDVDPVEEEPEED